MDNCLLCLQQNTTINCIQVQSKQWTQFDILNIIEKYFWPIENLHPNVGICHGCWQQLYDFHTFHKAIEEAHQRNIKLANQRLLHTSWHPVDICDNFNAKHCVENKYLKEQKKSLHVPFQLVLNNDVCTQIHVKEEILDETFLNQQSDRHTCPVTVADSSKNGQEDNNTINEENIINKPKGKRGRPRKLPNTNEIQLKRPKGKRGRPKKIAENSEIVIKQKPGKRGRPRKKIKIVDTVKKGKRGRPRKVQIPENIDDVLNVNEARASASLEFANLEQPEVVQHNTEQLLENISLPQQNTRKVIKKGEKLRNFIYKKHIDKIKKRKSLKQHKALMRNYIATSVRCMSFIKK